MATKTRNWERELEQSPAADESKNILSGRQPYSQPSLQEQNPKGYTTNVNCVMSEEDHDALIDVQRIRRKRFGRRETLSDLLNAGARLLIEQEKLGAK